MLIHPTMFSFLLSNATTKLHKFLFVTDREFWYEEARSALRRRLQQNPPSTGSKTHARNVILFIGDGMGIATVTASRILRGQRLGKSGEEQELAWDKFPAVAIAKVRIQLRQTHFEAFGKHALNRLT